MLTVASGLVVTFLYDKLPNLFPNNYIASNITFLSPDPGDEIALKTELKGKVVPAVPNKGSYWIIMRDDGGDHYLPAKITPTEHGNWTHSLELAPNWKGRPAVVVFLLADKGASEILGTTGSSEKIKLTDDMQVLGFLNLKVEP